MKKLFFLISILIFCLVSYGQKSLKNIRKPTLSDVRSINQENIFKIDLGLNKDQVLEIMGGIQRIQTYSETRDPAWGYFPKEDVIMNPYSRDLKYAKDGSTVEIIWYYTDVKEQDGAINKDELTPIILEKNKVVGIGWGFYLDYAKRNEITIDIK